LGVYVIQLKGLPYVKIGAAKSLRCRVEQLQIGSPLEIVVLGWMSKAPDSVEAELHDCWAACLYRGEWFLPDAVMEGWLKTLTVDGNRGRSPVESRTGAERDRKMALAHTAARWMASLRASVRAPPP
jgi:hypothetical protein